MKTLKQTLIAILSSKKAVMALFGATAAGLMKLGFNVDSETVGLVLTPILTAILGQGIADVANGKKQLDVAIEASKDPTK